jgi:hypothetical protein
MTNEVSSSHRRMWPSNLPTFFFGLMIGTIGNTASDNLHARAILVFGGLALFTLLTAKLRQWSGSPIARWGRHLIITCAIGAVMAANLTAGHAPLQAVVAAGVLIAGSSIAYPERKDSIWFLAGIALISIGCYATVLVSRNADAIVGTAFAIGRGLPTIVVGIVILYRGSFWGVNKLSRLVFHEPRLRMRIIAATVVGSLYGLHSASDGEWRQALLFWSSALCLGGAVANGNRRDRPMFGLSIFFFGVTTVVVGLFAFAESLVLGSSFLGLGVAISGAAVDLLTKNGHVASWGNSLQKLIVPRGVTEEPRNA